MYTRNENPMSATCGEYVLVTALGIATHDASVPTGSHLRHSYAYVCGVDPCHVPGATVRAESTIACPTIGGVPVSRGAVAETTSVAAEL